MAAKKRSTRGRAGNDRAAPTADVIPFVAEPPVPALPEDPAELRRLAEVGLRAERLADDATAAARARKAKLSEMDGRARRRAEHRPTAQDARKVSFRLQSIVLAVEAINRLVPVAQENSRHSEALWCLVGEATRSIARAGDAAVCVLDGTTAAVGVFADDLEH